jgi:hypothetical protein
MRPNAVWHFFEHEGISLKKSLHATEQDRPDVARWRAQWKKYQGWLDPSRLVFIDETWAKTKLTRSHGRARRGPAKNLSVSASLLLRAGEVIELSAIAPSQHIAAPRDLGRFQGEPERGAAV